MLLPLSLAAAAAVVGVAAALGLLLLLLLLLLLAPLLLLLLVVVLWSEETINGLLLLLLLLDNNDDDEGSPDMDRFLARAASLSLSLFVSDGRTKRSTKASLFLSSGRRLSLAHANRKHQPVWCGGWRRGWCAPTAPPKMTTGSFIFFKSMGNRMSFIFIFVWIRIPVP